jgi:hypothetical protein
MCVVSGFGGVRHAASRRVVDPVALSDLGASALGSLPRCPCIGRPATALQHRVDVYIASDSTVREAGVVDEEPSSPRDHGGPDPSGRTDRDWYVIADCHAETLSPSHRHERGFADVRTIVSQAAARHDSLVDHFQETPRRPFSDDVAALIGITAVLETQLLADPDHDTLPDWASRVQPGLSATG